MQVQTILARKGDRVATITSTEPLRAAVGRLNDEGVGALVVSDDGSTIDGILSERDVVRRLAVNGPAALDEPVSAAMTAEVVTCRPDDEIDRLMHWMTERRVRHLPVQGPDDTLVGIVSIGDVVKLRLLLLESENQALSEYVSGAR